MFEPCAKFAHPEQMSIAKIPAYGNDMILGLSHNFRMAKPRHRPEPIKEWFVPEWLEYLGLKQTVLVEATGRSPGRISEIVHGWQRWNSEDLAAFSAALGVSKGYLVDVNPLTVEGGRLAAPWKAPRAAPHAMPTSARKRPAPKLS